MLEQYPNFRLTLIVQLNNFSVHAMPTLTLKGERKETTQNIELLLYSGIKSIVY